MKNTLKNDEFGVCRVIYKPGERYIESITTLGKDGVERVQYTDGETLAEYMADKGGQGFEVMPREIAEPMMWAAQMANARLIAAAPEMLHALSVIFTIALEPHHEKALEVIKEIARKTIAKAEGRDS